MFCKKKEKRNKNPNAIIIKIQYLQYTNRTFTVQSIYDSKEEKNKKYLMFYTLIKTESRKNKKKLFCMNRVQIKQTRIPETVESNKKIVNIEM